jgi:membrane-bound lytic murein transglycosylase D
MQMKIRFSHIPLATTLAVVFASLGCQSAKKPVAPLLPPAAPAPVQAQSAPPSHPIASHQGSSHPTVEAQRPASAPVHATENKPDPVQELITRAEAEYKAGLDLSLAGQPEQAKGHFDRAFNLLLGSPAGMRSDPRYQKEFDRITEGVSTLEAASQPPPDSAAEKPEEQKSEPAPIDEANEVTNYPVDPNLKAKAAAEIKATHSDLPLMMTDQVAGYINYFSTRGRGTLERGLTRSGRYREMIERTFKEEGVPQDLIYLAQAESGFHPYAVSRAGARGIWQFMGSRARAYDLHRDAWTDERQDPEKSTRAAARHLKDLYNQFGDWYLAMAAYNSGPGTVQSAVKRTGYADFWELYRRNVLPKETRNYVPIILAVTIMAKNPEQYGLSSIVKDKPLAYDTVKIDYPIDLRLVAECVDASAADLQDLNPSLLRMTTPKNEAFELHLPAGTGKTFQSTVASIPVDKRVWWRYHKVQEGETLASIARAYRTSPRSIAQANDLDDEALAADSRLIIPIAPGKERDTSTYARAITRYKIRRGDTVESVAANFGVSVKMVRLWNRLKGDSLAGRRILLVHLPVSPAARETQVASKSKSTLRKSSHKPESATGPVHARTQTAAAGTVHHRVKPGETLYSIASSYNTTVSALKKNNRNVAVLRPGMILVVRDVR